MADGVEPPTGTRRLVELLDRAKHRFEPAAREEKVRALRALAGRAIRDPSLLIHLHEALCFLQASPDDPEVLDRVEEALRGFEAGVRLATRGRPAARRCLDDTGMAGTAIHYPFGYRTARWLARSFPGAAEIDWGAFREEARLREILALLVARPEQDALDDEQVPIREGVRAAKRARAQTDLAWLIGLVDGSPLPYAAKDYLLESLDLPVRWRGEGVASRTLVKVPPPPSSSSAARCAAGSGRCGGPSARRCRPCAGFPARRPSASFTRPAAPSRCASASSTTWNTPTAATCAWPKRGGCGWP